MKKSGSWASNLRSLGDCDAGDIHDIITLRRVYKSLSLNIYYKVSRKLSVFCRRGTRTNGGSWPNTSGKHNDENLDANIKTGEAHLSRNPDKSLCDEERFNQIADPSSSDADTRAEIGRSGDYPMYTVYYIILCYVRREN